MKKKYVSVVIVLLILTFGCATVDNVAVKNKAVAQQAFDAMNNFNLDALDEFIAPNYKRHSQATPDANIESLEHFKGFIQGWFDAFPDMKGEVHHLIAQGDLVAFYVTYTGTQTGAMGDIPPTGKIMDSKTFGFHRFENGKIVETWVTWDNLIVMKQLGLFPPPGVEAPK